MRFWGMRSGRERIAMCAAGIAIVVALMYAIVLAPAFAEHRRLSASLPKLRAQIEDMRLQEKEIAALRKKVAALSQRGDLKPLLQSSAARMSFANSIERIDALPGDKTQFLAAPVIYDDWLAWAENLQREFGIRLESARITATEQPGLARVDATFALTGPRAAKKAP
jgi:type II secretory pathway component PulM